MTLTNTSSVHKLADYENKKIYFSQETECRRPDLDDNGIFMHYNDCITSKYTVNVSIMIMAFIID